MKKLTGAFLTLLLFFFTSVAISQVDFKQAKSTGGKFHIVNTTTGDTAKVQSLGDFDLLNVGLKVRSTTAIDSFSVVGDTLKIWVGATQYNAFLPGAAPGGLSSEAAWSIVLNNSGSSAVPTGVKISALTDRAAFGAGDKLMMEESTGELRKIDFSDLPGAGGGISNIVEDTTPQLGGDLDANAFDIQFDDGDGIHDDSDNEQLLFSKTASAVNHFQISNAATGLHPSLDVIGTDSDINLTLDGKGTGTVRTLSSNLDITGNIIVSGTVDGKDIAANAGMLNEAETITSTWALGTPASATLTNATGLPISSGVSGLGSGIATFLATPSSSNFASAVTGETGTGGVVFDTSPTIVTPTIAATGWTNANHAHTATNSGGQITEASISDLQSYLLNVVEDTTPQLGADLDANAFDIQFDDADGIHDSNDNEQLIFQLTASAVNYIEITNAATAGEPLLQAVGSDTDVSLTLDGQGAGTVRTLSSNLDITGNIIVSGTVDGKNIATNAGMLNEAETITSTWDLGTPSAMVGTNLSGTGASFTAGVSTLATVTDNEATAETNAIIFTAGGDLDGGNLGLESDGDLTYTPNTGNLSATQIGGIVEASLVDKTAGETVTGNWVFDGNISVGNTTTSAGVLTLLEDDDAGSNFASFQVPALAANTAYILPPAFGSAGQQLTDAAGDGVLSWAAVGSGTGAFSDAGDPVVLNTTTKNVEIGDTGVALDAKVQIAGDADEVQLIVEGHSTQTDDIFIVQQDDETQVFTVSNAGVVTIATDLAVTEGGTGVSALDDILGTTDEISVAAGANTIIGGDVTLTLPDIFEEVMIPAGYFNPKAGDLTGATALADDADNTNDFTLDQLEFSGTAENFASAVIRMPPDWDGSTAPTFRVQYYTETSTASNTVDWEISTGYIRPGTDTWIAAIGTGVATAHNPTTLDIWYETALLSPTPAGTAAVGAFIKIRLKRDGDDGANDTHNVPARLVYLIMAYLKTTYGDETAF